MLTPELLDFIRMQLAEGRTRSELSAMLLSEGGWNQSDVDEAFRALETPKVTHSAVPATPLPPQVQPTPQTTSEPSSPVAMMQAMDSALAAKESPLSQLLKAEEMRASGTESAVQPSSVPPASTFATTSHTPDPASEISVISQAEVAPLHTSPPPPAVVVGVHSLAPATPVPPQHSALPVISPSEDFLGIFGTSPESTSPSEVASPVSAPQGDSFGKRVEIHTSGTKGSETVAAASRLASPHPEQAKFNASGMKVETSASSAITPTPGITTVNFESEKPPTPMVKFNLERMRGPAADLGGPKAPPPLGTAGGHEIAEASGPKSPTPFASSIPSGGIAAPTPGGTSQRSPLFSKRTMASDILLQGMSGASAVYPSSPSMPPPLTTLDGAIAQKIATSNPPPPSLAPEIIKEVPAEHTLTSTDIMKTNRTKRVIGTVIGALFLLTAIGSAGYGIMHYMGGGAESVLTSTLANFFNSSAFGHSVDAKVDLTLTDKQKIGRASSHVAFTFTSKGGLESGVSGYGDGMHRVKLATSIESGNFALPTNLEADIAVKGSSLYFHLVAFPKTSDLDPVLFEKYWIKVDLSEIAKELALSGVLAAGGEYGGFGGGGGGGDNFVALMKKHQPLLAEKTIADDGADAENTEHVSFRVDLEKGLLLVLDTYRKYVGKELVLSDDQRIRLKNALQKIEGELWVNKNEGSLVRVLLRADFDDVIVDTGVVGSMSIDLALSDINKPLSIAVPDQVLTLEELRVEMEKYKALKTIRMKDQVMIDRMEQITMALRAYYESKGLYPHQLTGLYRANLLASTTIPEPIASQYFYAPYVSDGSFTKAGRCTPTGKICGYYHLGVNLEARDRAMLEADADQATDVRGADERGCAGEKDLSCYDVVSPSTEEQATIETAPIPDTTP